MAPKETPRSAKKKVKKKVVGSKAYPIDETAAVDETAETLDESPPLKPAIRVTVTGGAGQIAYSLLPALLSGGVFGTDQPIFFALLDIEPAMEALKGFIMELEDLREPLYAGALGSSDPAVAFKDADYVVFLGAFPRKAGMERKDVMQKNVGIFNAQGAALAEHAKPTVKCVVVGNPANTNAAILARAAPNIPKSNITALTRLDHNRAASLVASKADVPVDAVDGIIIWGNHSSTQFPDVRHATVNGSPVLEQCADYTSYFEGDFISTVQKRGAAIIAARKLSSAASAARAICDHLRDWAVGSGDRWVSMGVFSDGSAYGIPSGVMYSFPVVCTAGEWTVVPDLSIDNFAHAILGLVEAYKADPSPHKVNLSVGAYRDDGGAPWVLPSVEAAEAQLTAEKLPKEYAPIAGDPSFVAAALRFAFGAESAPLADGRVAAVQSLSGTGALRLCAEFYARFLGRAAPVYLPSPSWGNHQNVFRDAGLDVRTYRYWDGATLGLDFEGMVADIMAAPDGAVILLHACAHNPTGVDPSVEQWKALCTALQPRRGLKIIFDCAYQGFASGDAEADAFALRHFVSEGVPFALTQSFAKNFGLYGERIGAVSVVCQDADEAARVLSQLKIIARPIYSNPPIHGARIVSKILSDDSLTAQWRTECKAMADRIISMRQALREELSKTGSSREWAHITSQIGMFCFTGLSAAQVAALTAEHHIYLTKDGRISMAGLNSSNVAYVAAALHDVTSKVA